MRLADVLGPVGVDTFRERHLGRQPFVLRPPPGVHRFADLVTLEQIEARFNDGCASDVSLQAIGRDGRKLDPSELVVAQTGTAWSRRFLDRARVAALLAEGCSFVMHNCSQITPQMDALLADVEALLPSCQADVHVYLSPAASASGYEVHKDVPQHKLYLQLHGTTAWTLYGGTHPARSMSVEAAREALTVDAEVELGPGALLYLPPGVFHRATNPYGPRVSLSIPFYSSPGARPVDRTPIPLASMLRG